MLEQARSADRGFDAVVVGEFERAFTDRQFEQVARRLERFGVRVWLPEAGGPVELDDPAHHVLMKVLAAQSRREVVDGSRQVASTRSRAPRASVRVSQLECRWQRRWWAWRSPAALGPAFCISSRRVTSY